MLRILVYFGFYLYLLSNTPLSLPFSLPHFLFSSTLRTTEDNFFALPLFLTQAGFKSSGSLASPLSLYNIIEYTLVKCIHCFFHNIMLSLFPTSSQSAYLHCNINSLPLLHVVHLPDCFSPPPPPPSPPLLSVTRPPVPPRSLTPGRTTARSSGGGVTRWQPTSQSCPTWCPPVVPWRANPTSSLSCVWRCRTWSLSEGPGPPTQTAHTSHVSSPTRFGRIPFDQVVCFVIFYIVWFMRHVFEPRSLVPSCPCLLITHLVL